MDARPKSPSGTWDLQEATFAIDWIQVAVKVFANLLVKNRTHTSLQVDFQQLVLLCLF